MTVTQDFYVENICYSGGAVGADQVFGECAAKAGHKVVHFTFDGHKSAVVGHFLTNEELRTADFELKEANKMLRRTFPTKNEYVNNLLRRNYFQIRNASKIYAVTSLDDRGIPYGGTAWAVVMGILGQKINEVYVFDQADNNWYQYCGYAAYKDGFEWNKKSMDVPRPLGHYAGIGTRELTDNGRKAIEDLYK